MAAPIDPAGRSSMLGAIPKDADELLRLREEVDTLAKKDVAELALFKPPKTVDVVSPTKRKNALLEQERARLTQEYSERLLAEKEEMQMRLQREFAMREREDRLTQRALAELGHKYGLNDALSAQSKGPPSKEARQAFIYVTTDYGYSIIDCIGAVSGTTLRNNEEALAGGIDHPGSLGKKGQQEALSVLVENAMNRGANAVVGLRFDASAPVGPMHVETIAYGTAVTIKKDGKGSGQDGKNKGGGGGGKAQKQSKEESFEDALARAHDQGSSRKGGKKGSSEASGLAGQVGYNQIRAVMDVLMNGPKGGISGGNSGGWGSNSGGGGNGWGSSNNNDSWGGSGGSGWGNSGGNSGGGSWGDSGGGSIGNGGGGWGNSSSGGGWGNSGSSGAETWANNDSKDQVSWGNNTSSNEGLGGGGSSDTNAWGGAGGGQTAGWGDNQGGGDSNQSWGGQSNGNNNGNGDNSWGNNPGDSSWGGGGGNKGGSWGGGTGNSGGSWGDSKNNNDSWTNQGNRNGNGNGPWGPDNGNNNNNNNNSWGGSGNQNHSTWGNGGGNNNNGNSGGGWPGNDSRGSWSGQYNGPDNRRMPEDLSLVAQFMRMMTQGDPGRQIPPFGPGRGSHNPNTPMFGWEGL